MEPMPASTRLPFLELLSRHVVEIGVAAAIAVIAWRLADGRAEGLETASWEHQAERTLKAIHRAEQEAKRSEGRYLLLSEILERAGAAASLGALHLDPAAADGVDLGRVGGYFVAVAIDDPASDDGRAWSQADRATAAAGRASYAAYAWPVEYAERSQWAYFVDRRGFLLGSWNHDALFDGTKEPFPPELNPLKDYLAAERAGKDAEWFVFADPAQLGEIE